ncbi:MAG: DNA polymerase I [Planctomycetota bacterium]|jgi:DNA polymerase-1
MAETLYIIDGHSQMYRAYYARFRDLTSPTGEPTRATYVFCSMLLRFVSDRRPDYLAMAIDGPPEKLHRREAFADYKITRKPAPEDFHPQAERIVQIVRTLNIPILQAEGYEADDIIATAVENFAGPDVHVVVVSRDKDLDQLVGEHVMLCDPMKDETLDAAALEKLRGYPPEKAVEVQSLMGDSIDNIPGVPGVGPKTAADLIAKYGTADAVVSHAEQLTPKLRENVLANKDNVALARQLVTLERQVPVELDLETMRFSGVRADAVRPIFEELGFSRLLERLDEQGKVQAAPSKPPKPSAKPSKQAAVSGGTTTAADFDYKCINTSEKLDELTRQLSSLKRIAIDTETTSTQPMWAELVGISLAWETGRAVYIPVKGPLGAATLEPGLVREKLGAMLADTKVEKIGQNIKYDMIVLSNAGFDLAGPMFDTMVAAHVLDSSRMTYALGALAAEMLNHRCMPIEEIIGRGKKQITMDAAPIDLVTKYAAEDADVALRLSQVMRTRLAEEGLTKLFEKLEMPLVPVLAKMEQTGVLLDPGTLKRMDTQLSAEADNLRDRIITLAGHQFNVLGLPILKRTKTGASTNASVLEQLAVQQELPGLVLDYRKLTKLTSTYLKALAECIHPRTGRVHTSFHQTATETGRLSSSDPNLQNIPVRSEQGRQIRSAFVAPPGCVLLSADYSQVEPRVLAHLCQDPTLTAAFEADQDIHRIVAAEVFGVKAEEVTPEQRAKAKTVNFGIIYGQTAYGLSLSLRIPRREAQDFINRYKKRFPKIEEFLQACIKQAKSHGYVETIFGRRRRIKEIDSRNPQRRAMAERLAINSVVQGSAADLIKQAMVNIDSRVTREERPSKMLIQIHDELVFEIPEADVEAEREMIVEEMSGAIKLRVPLKVDTAAGKNWLEAK